MGARKRPSIRERAIPHDAIQMRVDAGEPIPQPGSVVQARSPMTGYLYAIRVHSIAKLVWVYNGSDKDIIGIDVWLCGEKQLVGDSAPGSGKE